MGPTSAAWRKLPKWETPVKEWATAPAPSRRGAKKADERGLDLGGIRGRLTSESPDDAHELLAGELERGLLRALDRLLHSTASSLLALDTLLGLTLNPKVSLSSEP
jgi:hypothetical protein